MKMESYKNAQLSWSSLVPVFPHDLNVELYPVNFNVMMCFFVFESIGDYSCMIGLITEESLTFGLLTFLRL